MPEQSWVAIPAWAVPVWATLDGDASALDPLEAAVLDLIRAGIPTEAAMADTLGLPRSLVNSALATLATQGRIEGSAAGWTPTLRGDADRPPEPVTRSGWVAWDATTQRVCAELYLGDELADFTAPLPDVMHPFTDTDRPRSAPRHQLDDDLRLLAGSGALRVFDGGVRNIHEVEEVDGARVRLLRRKLDARAKQGVLWVPVEHRVAGSVVWRPCLVPRRAHDCELDPGGWQGLHDRVSPAIRAALSIEQAEVLEQVAPGVLHATGFDSVAALRESAEREARRELQVGAEAPSALLQAVTEAYIYERLAEAAGSTWRELGRGWADVAEASAQMFFSPLEAELQSRRDRAPARDDLRESQLRRLCGAALYQAFERRKLTGLPRNKQHVTIAEALESLLFVAQESPRLRERLLRLDDEHRGLLPTFDEVREMRNRVSHRRGVSAGDTVDVEAFRRKALFVARAAVRWTELSP